MQGRPEAEHRLQSLQVRIREKAASARRGGEFELVAVRVTQRKTANINSSSSPYDLTWPTKPQAESDAAFLAFADKLVAEFSTTQAEGMVLGSSSEDGSDAGAPAGKRARVGHHAGQGNSLDLRSLNNAHVTQADVRQSKVALLPPDLRLFVEDRSQQDLRDGTKLHKTIRLGREKLARDAKFAALNEKHQGYVTKLEQARKSVSKSVIVVDESGEYLELSALSRPMFARYIEQLIALRHYYTYLLEHRTADDELYATETNALQCAAERTS